MMNEDATPPRHIRPAAWIAAVGLGIALLGAAMPSAFAQSGFPSISLWSYPGAHVSSAPDSVEARSRTNTVRWRRDFAAELRSDFGGYRIYRATSARDTTNMVLLRRFSRQRGDSLLMWHFDPLDTVLQFVDPDSAGNFVKVCKRVDRFNRCLSIGDSVFKLITPSGPHDGYAIYYTVTYEAKNTTDNNYQDLFVPDTLTDPGLTQAQRYASCDTVGRPNTCPNQNAKATNLMTFAVYPTGGPTPNLEQVGVVPNPYRASEPWDQPGGHEVHFINLPVQAQIRVYTVAGDLVITIDHNDTVHDFARWDLKNSNGADVASGIYIYRIDAANFSHQDRFIVVR